MNRALLIATAALASGTLGCSTFYAEAEQPLVCMTLPTQSFSVPGGGIPAPAGGFHGSYTTTLVLGIQDVLPDFLLNGPPSEHVLHFVSFDATVAGAPGATTRSSLPSDGMLTYPSFRSHRRIWACGSRTLPTACPLRPISCGPSLPRCQETCSTPPRLMAVPSSASLRGSFCHSRCLRWPRSRSFNFYGSGMTCWLH